MRTRVSMKVEGDGERGSALLVVLLFAAMVAIFLYKEIPVVATEAKRQQEQVLVDRGMQYERAIQLFYRKMGRYPPTIDALENTNNIRFLRKRYKDPLTGEDNWRLLHMGPSGPIDSLVNPLNKNGNGQPFGQNATNQDGFGQSSFGQSGSQSGFGQSSSQSGFGQSGPQSGFGQSGFGQSGFGATGQANGQAAQDQNAGNAAAANSQSGGQPDASPPPNRRAPAISAAGNGEDSATGGQSDPNQMPVAQNSSQPQTVQGGTPPGSQPVPPGGTGPGQNGNQGQPGADPNSSIANQILRTPSPTNTPQFQQAGGGQGANPFSAGNLGGVASRGKGHSIKVINDQTDYSKWEFVYDYRKDTSAGQPAPAVAAPTNQSSFSATPSTSTSSSFASSTSPPATQPANPPPAPSTSPNQ